MPFYFVEYYQHDGILNILLSSPFAVVYTTRNCFVVVVLVFGCQGTFQVLQHKIPYIVFTLKCLRGLYDQHSSAMAMATTTMKTPITS